MPAPNIRGAGRGGSGATVSASGSSARVLASRVGTILVWCSMRAHVASAGETAKGVVRAANADGSSTWTVTVGGMVGPSDLQQFYQPKLDIRVGDTVVWKSAVPTPHTATFLGGTALPIPPIPENPKVMQPAPAPKP